MREPTVSRDVWEAQERAWSEGGFGPAWGPVRRMARARGMWYPPSGSAHDDRDSQEPSQRAIVWRALEDNPAELAAIIGRASSWSGVVDRIIGLEARLRTDADYTERDAEWERRDDPTHPEAVRSIAGILERIEAAR